MRFDAIVSSIDGITKEVIEQAREARRRSFPKPYPDIEEIDRKTLVIRVMTSEHIPVVEYPRKYAPPKYALAKTPFHPFKHYVVSNHEPIEVLRSHWKGDLESGWFDIHHGKTNSKLALMYMLLVERYATRPNFIGYSYRDEMEAVAVSNLAEGGLKFNEAKSSNPFAYLTTIVHNAFLKVLAKEKTAQNIRDDILQDAGFRPSMTRQLEDLWRGY